MLVKAKDILQNRERQGYRGRDVLLTMKSRERQGYSGCVPRDMLLRLKSRGYRDAYQSNPETCCTVKTGKGMRTSHHFNTLLIKTVQS